LPSLDEAILVRLDDNEGRAFERGLLYQACCFDLRQDIKKKQFDDAVDQLKTDGHVEASEEWISRAKLPFKEEQLEDKVELYLRSVACCEALRVEQRFTVVCKTARKGARDTGKYSKPDFTLATVRQLKYDPLRHLDVLTFELKTGLEATVEGVHEALAHTRFAYYAYFVHPRSRVSQRRKTEVREECARHGLGLLTFDLASTYDKKPDLYNFEVELKPLRKMPDPFEVEAFLQDRFSPEDLARLEDIAKQMRGSFS
jgi:hypothetical protein